MYVHYTLHIHKRDAAGLAFYLSKTQEQWLMALSVLSSMEDATVRPNVISCNSVTKMQKAGKRTRCYG